MLPRSCLAVSLALLVSFSARAETRCDKALKHLGDQLVDATCVESADLTTKNLATTPADNSIVELAPGAFTPSTDRGVIAPSAAKRPPIVKVVPGVQINGRIAGDPTG